MTAARRYIVDASVGAQWFFSETGSRGAMALLDRAAVGAVALAAPEVFTAEVANVIWKRARLRREITDDQARAALDELTRLLPQLVQTAALVEQALELALAFRVPVYDCLYVALALRDGSTLVSADRALVRAFGAATGRVAHIEDIAFGV